MHICRSASKIGWRSLCRDKRSRGTTAMWVPRWKWYTLSNIKWKLIRIERSHDLTDKWGTYVSKLYLEKGHMTKYVCHLTTLGWENVRTLGMGRRTKWYRRGSLELHITGRWRGSLELHTRDITERFCKLIKLINLDSIFIKIKLHQHVELRLILIWDVSAAKPTHSKCQVCTQTEPSHAARSSFWPLGKSSNVSLAHRTAGIGTKSLETIWNQSSSSQLM